MPPKPKSKSTPNHPLMLNGTAWNKQSVMDIVCQRVSTSSKSISTILKDGSGGLNLPVTSIVMLWLINHPELSEQYAHAKEAQTEYMAEEMMDIADDARNDYMENHKDGGYMLNGENVQRTKLRIETRKWLMGKLKPKKYGDKVALTGADGEGPIQHSLEISFVGSSGKTKQIN